MQTHALGDQRHHFEIPDDVCYLNCAYMAPLLRSAREVGERAVGRKSRPWELTPDAFFSEVEEARGLFAEMIRGDADGIALIPSVSYGIAVAAANVPVGRGQRIVVLDEQFPSNFYPWRELAHRNGAEVVVVPRPADHDWTRGILELVDERCAVVTVPNCHWTDGTLVDLRRVGEAAREAGAALVVDGIQSLGARPFDVTEVRPDFLVAASYKWLLGPYGVGFMHVSERFRDGIPIEHNWINRRGSEDFTSLTDYTDLFQPGARRFDVGERSNFALLPVANEALRQILDWGIPNVAAGISTLTSLVEKEARGRGMATAPAEKRAAHMIGLSLPPDAPEDLAARLASENVFVSQRANALRVSPHLYNTEADVELLFDVLDRLVR